MMAKFRRWRANTRNARKLRLFSLTFLLALICGVLEVGLPADEALRGLRNELRARPVDGKVVVVGIDDKTMSKLGGAHYSRENDAKALERMFELGAKRVFYDKAFADAGDKRGDEIFARTLEKYRGRVFLGAFWTRDAVTRERVEILPHSRFRSSADWALLNVKVLPFFLAIEVPERDKIAGRPVFGIAQLASGQPTSRERDKRHKIDLSFRLRSIPIVSMVDAIERSGNSPSIAGKDVFVANTSATGGDVAKLGMQGLLPGVLAHVAATQTLRENVPVDLGWVPPLVFGFLLAGAQLIAQSARRSVLLISFGVIGFLAVPLLLEAQNIYLDIFAGLVMYIVVLVRSRMLSLVQTTKEQNPLSGHANLVALRNVKRVESNTLVALAVRNYAQISSNFEENVEQLIIAELTAKLKAFDSSMQLYHDDEMLFWFSPLEAGEELQHHLQGLNGLLKSSVSISSRLVDLDVSFGVDVASDRPIDLRIRSAKTSAQEAARAGDTVKFFDVDAATASGWKLSMVSDLHNAIMQGQIWVAYQPKLDVRSNRIVGAEALARWLHPVRGAISPNEFIEFAEQNNAIDELTYFMIEKAVQDAVKLQTKATPFVVAVNLSVQMLQVADLPLQVQSILDRNGLAPHRLILEITETGQLKENERFVAVVEELRALGIGISIDDYGTGHATLDYLKRIPADEIKIDKRFVSGIGQHSSDDVLVKSTIDMAHALGRTVVAEGVETAEAFAALVEMGCDQIQGYLISQPVEFRVLKQMLRIKIAKAA